MYSTRYLLAQQHDKIYDIWTARRYEDEIVEASWMADRSWAVLREHFLMVDVGESY